MSNIENFLTTNEEQEIIKAIRKAEKNTSGEIRVHIENRCEVTASMERALEVFTILKMDNTKLQNAVLIYLAVDDKTFVIYGDKGIDAVVPNDFWNITKTTIELHFKHSEFAEGLVQGVLKIGEQLKVHFPWNHDDKNELPDAITKS